MFLIQSIVRYVYLLLDDAKIQKLFELPIFGYNFLHNLYFFLITRSAIRWRFERLYIKMKRLFWAIVVCLLPFVGMQAQERTVKNRPYTDLRTFHFGLHAGFHVQDLEFINVGPQTTVDEEGNTSEQLITCDQDRWDGGFNVGVLGELRLSEHFQFRVAPAMYFGTRHLTFRNFTASTPDRVFEETQGIKTAYITCALDLIFGSQRAGNRRPYVMLGLNPMINLSGKDNDFLKLKRTDLFLETGLGCDMYLPFFKLRPELKFLYGLTDCLDKDHAGNIRDKNMLSYTNSVKKARSKMIVLTFYFE